MSSVQKSNHRTRMASLSINDKNYPLYEGINTIGRCITATVPLKHLDVSKQHAIITIVNENQHYISDFQSFNGTSLNDSKLQPLKMYKLSEGSSIELANMSAVYNMVPIASQRENDNFHDYSSSNIENTQLVTQSFYNATTQAVVDETTTAISIPEIEKEPNYFDDDYDFEDVATQIVPSNFRNPQPKAPITINEMPTQTFCDDVQTPVSVVSGNAEKVQRIGNKANEISLDLLDDIHEMETQKADFIHNIATQANKSIYTMTTQVARVDETRDEEDLINTSIIDETVINDSDVAQENAAAVSQDSTQSQLHVSQLQRRSIKPIEDDSDTSSIENFESEEVFKLKTMKMNVIESGSETEAEDDVEENPVVEQSITNKEVPVHVGVPLNQDNNLTVIDSDSDIDDFEFNTQVINEDDDLIIPSTQMSDEEHSKLDDVLTLGSNIERKNSDDNEVVDVSKFSNSIEMESLYLEPTQPIVGEEILQPTEIVTDQDVFKKPAAPDTNKELSENIFLQPTQAIETTKPNTVIDDDIFLQPTQVTIFKTKSDPLTQNDDNIFEQPTQTITNDQSEIFLQPTQLVQTKDDDIFLKPTQPSTSKTIEDDIFDQPTQKVTVPNPADSEAVFLEQTQKYEALPESKTQIMERQLEEMFTSQKPIENPAQSVESQLEVVFDSQNISAYVDNSRPSNPLLNELDERIVGSGSEESTTDSNLTAIAKEGGETVNNRKSTQLANTNISSAVADDKESGEDSNLEADKEYHLQSTLPLDELLLDIKETDTDSSKRSTRGKKDERGNLSSLKKLSTKKNYEKILSVSDTEEEQNSKHEVEEEILPTKRTLRKKDQDASSTKSLSNFEKNEDLKSTFSLSLTPYNLDESKTNEKKLPKRSNRGKNNKYNQTISKGSDSDTEEEQHSKLEIEKAKLLPKRTSLQKKDSTSTKTVPKSEESEDDHKSTSSLRSNSPRNLDEKDTNKRNLPKRPNRGKNSKYNKSIKENSHSDSDEEQHSKFEVKGKKLATKNTTLLKKDKYSSLTVTISKLVDNEDHKSKSPTRANSDEKATNQRNLPKRSNRGKNSKYSKSIKQNTDSDTEEEKHGEEETLPTKRTTLRKKNKDSTSTKTITIEESEDDDTTTSSIASANPNERVDNERNLPKRSNRGKNSKYGKSIKQNTDSDTEEEKHGEEETLPTKRTTLRKKDKDSTSTKTITIEENEDDDTTTSSIASANPNERVDNKRNLLKRSNRGKNSKYGKSIKQNTDSDTEEEKHGEEKTLPTKRTTLRKKDKDSTLTKTITIEENEDDDTTTSSIASANPNERVDNKRNLLKRSNRGKNSKYGKSIKQNTDSDTEEEKHGEEKTLPTKRTTLRKKDKDSTLTKTITIEENEDDDTTTSSIASANPNERVDNKRNLLKRSNRGKNSKYGKSIKQNTDSDTEEEKHGEEETLPTKRTALRKKNKDSTLTKTITLEENEDDDTTTSSIASANPNEKVDKERNLPKRSNRGKNNKYSENLEENSSESIPKTIIIKPTRKNYVPLDLEIRNIEPNQIKDENPKHNIRSKRKQGLDDPSTSSMDETSNVSKAKMRRKSIDEGKTEKPKRGIKTPNIVVKDEEHSKNSVKSARIKSKQAFSDSGIALTATSGSESVSKAQTPLTKSTRGKRILSIVSETKDDIPKKKRKPSDSDSDDFVVKTPSRGNKLDNTITESTPERNKRITKPKVVFTMLDSPELESVIRSLGGKIVDSVESCTVVVTSNLKRSQKLLEAVGQGKPICSPHWIKECKKRKNFWVCIYYDYAISSEYFYLDPWDFILEDRDAEKKWKLSLKQSLNRSRVHKLLQGSVVYLLVTNAVDVLKGAIESCGGKCLLKPPPKSVDDFIVVANAGNKTKYSKFLKQKPPIKVVLPEAIFDGVLRQELHLEDHLLV